jgi:hypothetical protein
MTVRRIALAGNLPYSKLVEENAFTPFVRPYNRNSPRQRAFLYISIGGAGMLRQKYSNNVPANKAG